jgi:hypothetical protein
LANGGQFSATTRDGEPVNGRVLKSQRVTPLALTYTVGERTNDVFQVTYGYKSTNGLPSFIETRIPVVDNKIPTTASILVSISQIEYGIDPIISAGYRPFQFFPDMQAFTMIQVFKEDGRFSVEPNGILARINN